MPGSGERVNMRQCNPVSGQYHPVLDTNVDFRLMNKKPHHVPLSMRHTRGNTIDTTSYPETQMCDVRLWQRDIDLTEIQW